MFLEFLHLLPFIYYIYIIIILLVFGLISEYVKFNSIRMLYPLSIICLVFLLTFIIDAMEISLSFFGQKDSIFIIGFFMLILLLVFILLLAKDHFMTVWLWNYEYIIVLFLSILGMIIAIYSNNWLLTYLGLELHSLALYVLVAMNRYATLSLEATLKYFLLGSISSALMLFGISFVYGACGSLDFYDISYLILDLGFFGFQRAFLITGFICIMIGFFFKLAIFPFHTWAPDTYDGAIWLTVFIIAIIPKFGALLLLVKILNLFLVLFVKLDFFFKYCALVSIIFGAISALYQVRIRRFLAYSSISNFGYILLTLSVWPGSISFIYATQYLFIYILLLLGLFGLMLNLRFSRFSYPVSTFSELGSLNFVQNFLAWALSLFVISFAGLPPLAGFWSKFFVFYWLSLNDNYGLVILLLLVSVISAFYYLRMVRIFFFSKKNLKFFLPISLISAFIFSLLILFNLFCGPLVMYFLFNFNLI